MLNFVYLFVKGEVFGSVQKEQLGYGGIHRRTYIVEDYFHHSLDKLFLILRHIHHRVSEYQDSHAGILGTSSK